VHSPVMVHPPHPDLNDDKAFLEWLMRIQSAKDRAVEWMDAIKQQQGDLSPEGSTAKKQPAGLIASPGAGGARERATVEFAASLQS
jgi:hypothetical protein